MKKRRRTSEEKMAIAMEGIKGSNFAADIC